MRVPVCVTVGGHQILIDYVDELNDTNSEPLAGEAHAAKRYIKISKAYNKDAEAVRSTVLHEIFHIAIGLTGHDELLGDKREEAVVFALESMLAPLLEIHPKAAVKWREISFPFESRRK